MKIAHATKEIPAASESQSKAMLVVSLANFAVRHASPLAIDWLDFPLDRLLGRSLMLSVPLLGQALMLAVARGLSQLPTPLGISMVNPEGAKLLVSVHQVDADAIIELRLLQASP